MRPCLAVIADMGLLNRGTVAFYRLSTKTLSTPPLAHGEGRHKEQHENMNEGSVSYFKITLSFSFRY